jgi:hypothetical protein
MATAIEQGVASNTISLNPRELRQSQPCDEEVILRDRQGIEHIGRATAASTSTLAVVLDNVGFAAGDVIEAEFGGVMIPATVHRAYRQPHGKWIIIVRWGQ